MPQVTKQDQQQLCCDQKQGQYFPPSVSVWRNAERHLTVHGGWVVGRRAVQSEVGKLQSLVQYRHPTRHHHHHLVHATSTGELGLTLHSAVAQVWTLSQPITDWSLRPNRKLLHFLVSVQITTQQQSPQKKLSENVKWRSVPIIKLFYEDPLLLSSMTCGNWRVKMSLETVNVLL